MSSTIPPSAFASALYFDGRSARAVPVRLQVSNGLLLAWKEDAHVEAGRWPLAQVRWPERTRHGQRVILLVNGGTLQAADSDSFDAWRATTLGHRDSWVVRAQLHWQAVMLALFLLAGVLFAAYRWGVPWVAMQLVRALPVELDESVGEAALRSLDEYWLAPSTLSLERQAQLRADFERAVRTMDPAPPRWTLHFRSGQSQVAAGSENAPARKSKPEPSSRGLGLGPNALALPGGHIVITDELLRLLNDQDETILGVLGHEYGHVRLRHGMQSLTRATLIAALVGAVMGDFSGFLSAAPALLAHMDYSREAEREADAEAVRLMRANRISPKVMVLFFERLEMLRQDMHKQRKLPIALSSHPADAERIRFFTEAAGR